MLAAKLLYGATYKKPIILCSVNPRASEECDFRQASLERMERGWWPLWLRMDRTVGGYNHHFSFASLTPQTAHSL